MQQSIRESIWNKLRESKIIVRQAKESQPSFMQQINNTQLSLIWNKLRESKTVVQQAKESQAYQRN